MLFSSPIFLFAFLPLVLIGYFCLPAKLRNPFLLLSSIIFYFWGEPSFIWMVLMMIVINYLIAIFIHLQKQSLTKSKLILLIGVSINLYFLWHYKYLDFFLQRLSLSPIPLAISFFVFHAISYLIDTYHQKIIPQVNILKLGLYFLLFPHLLAGPIIRYRDIRDQLSQRKIILSDFSIGAVRFIFGLAKKVLIADTLAAPINEIFATPAAHLLPSVAWFGLIAFTLQIYFDFSGYSDMAIGLGKIFGFKFPENFNYPYAATSLTDFWRRWHITLSNWFRDYLYIPLGGNRVPALRHYLNIWLVFLLVGLWHGASWSFIIWGIYQGLFLILERINFLADLVRRLALPKLVSHFYLILVVMIGWVFFRSANLDQAWEFIQQLALLADGTAYLDAYHPLDYFIHSDILIVTILGSIISFPIFNNIHRTPVNQAVLIFLLFVLLIISASVISIQTYNPFIYFRF